MSAPQPPQDQSGSGEQQQQHGSDTPALSESQATQAIKPGQQPPPSSTPDAGSAQGEPVAPERTQVLRPGLSPGESQESSLGSGGVAAEATQVVTPGSGAPQPNYGQSYVPPTSDPGTGSQPAQAPQWGSPTDAQHGQPGAGRGSSAGAGVAAAPEFPTSMGPQGGGYPAGPPQPGGPQFGGPGEPQAMGQPGGWGGPQAGPGGPPPGAPAWDGPQGGAAAADSTRLIRMIVAGVAGALGLLGAILIVTLWIGVGNSISRVCESIQPQDLAGCHSRYHIAGSLIFYFIVMILGGLLAVGGA
ncbi:MAG: hypothetical protein ACRDRL_33390, partial [Sciscionella sp.]